MGRRIRSIKPEIVEDDKAQNLGHLEWRLFVSLWVIADDYGNLRGEADFIRGNVLWAKRHANDDVAAALVELEREGLIGFYRARGQLYLHIAGWSKHQKVDKPSKPHMPGPDDDGSEAVRIDTSNSRNPRETLDSDRDQDQDQDREGRAGGPSRENDPPGEHQPPTQPPTSPEPRLSRSPATTPDPDQIKARRALGDWGLDELNRIRARVAKKHGLGDVQPVPEQGRPRLDLVDRLREAGPAAKTQLEHVLRIAELEAIAKKTVEYLGGSIFGDTSWAKKLAMTEADAMRAIGGRGPANEPPRALKVRRDDDDPPPLGGGR